MKDGYELGGEKTGRAISMNYFHGQERVLESCGHLFEDKQWELKAKSAVLMNS